LIVGNKGLQLGLNSSNDDAPLYFYGATGASDGAGGYLSNFRVGNGIIGGDIFEITPNDGAQGATTWKGTPALAIQGTNNRVGINTTSFSGTDNSGSSPVQRNYILNVQGDMNLNGQFFQNNEEFVTSRWTQASNTLDIYRLSRVGINKADPTYTLHVASGTVGGSTANATLTTAQLASHSHPLNIPGPTFSEPGQTGVNPRRGSSFNFNTSNQGSGTGHSHNMSATFTGSATSVVQPYLTVIYIIKT